MVDRYFGVTPRLSDPGDDGFAVTPGDTAAADFPQTCRAIVVGVSGAVTVLTANNTVFRIPMVLAGSPFPIRAKRVFQTGTSASDIAAVV